MAAKLLETILPAQCSWCTLPLHVFLEIPSAGSDAAGSLILCPACDGSSLPLVRERVAGFGRLEKRGDVLVWVRAETI